MEKNQTQQNNRYFCAPPPPQQGGGAPRVRGSGRSPTRFLVFLGGVPGFFVVHCVFWALALLLFLVLFYYSFSAGVGGPVAAWCGACGPRWCSSFHFHRFLPSCVTTNQTLPYYLYTQVHKSTKSRSYIHSKRTRF